MNELPKAQYGTKAAVVKALKESLADATAQLKNGPATPGAKLTDLWVSFTEHSGEHYGQIGRLLSPQRHRSARFAGAVGFQLASALGFQLSALGSRLSV